MDMDQTSYLTSIIDALRERGIPLTSENIESLKRERENALSKVELEAKLTPDFLMTILNQHSKDGLTIREILELLNIAENDETRRKMGAVLDIMEGAGQIKREPVNGGLRNFPGKETEC